MIANLKPETEAAIRARAHQIWEEEGRPNGRHDIHWQRAYEAIVDVASVAPAKKQATPEIEHTKEVQASKPTRAKASAKKK